MQKSFPFNANLTSDGYDRVYTAEDFAAERAAYVSDGVLKINALKVIPSSGRIVSVSAGMACVRGRTYWNTDAFNITLTLSHAQYPRIDRIVLRLNYTDREIALALKTGTAAASPSAPALVDNETMCELPIAKITVAANSSVISASAITDERILASFPLDYADIVEIYTRELRDQLGVSDLANLKIIGNYIKVNGDGKSALFNDGAYKPVEIISELARFTSNGTFSTYNYPSKDNLYHIMMIGGGGGGGAVGDFTGANLISMGGGSGAVLNFGPAYIAPGSYAVTVGTGGSGGNATTGTNGGNTTFAGYSAGGGQGGRGGTFTQPSVAATHLGGTGYLCFTGQNGADEGSGGKGGSTMLGNGGTGITGEGAVGGNATGYGAGGGQGGKRGRGGNGTPGIVIVYGYK